MSSRSCRSSGFMLRRCYQFPTRSKPTLLPGRLHDRPREEVQPRGDGVELDVLRLLAVLAVAHEPEVLDDDGLSGERRERRVGAAALSRVVDAEGLADLGVDTLSPLHQRALAVVDLQRRAAEIGRAH